MSYDRGTRSDDVLHVVVLYDNYTKTLPALLILDIETFREGRFCRKVLCLVGSRVRHLFLLLFSLR